MAVNPATDTIYATSVFGKDMSVVDGHTNKVTATIKLGGEPLEAAADPKTDTIYVTNGTVQVIDGHTNKITATVGVGKVPVGVAVDPSPLRVPPVPASG